MCKCVQVTKHCLHVFRLAEPTASLEDLTMLSASSVEAVLPKDEEEQEEEQQQSWGSENEKEQQLVVVMDTGGNVSDEKPKSLSDQRQSSTEESQRCSAATEPEPSTEQNSDLKNKWHLVVDRLTVLFLKFLEYFHKLQLFIWWLVEIHVIKIISCYIVMVCIQEKDFSGLLAYCDHFHVLIACIVSCAGVFAQLCYCFFLASMLTIQYFVCIGIPLAACKDYPWRFPNSTTDSNVIKWLYVPDFQMKPDPYFLIYDFMLLLCASLQRQVFDDENKAAVRIMAGDNVEICRDLDAASFSVHNPVPDFIHCRYSSLPSVNFYSLPAACRR
ncbi:hypothetical protein XENOCAPTIV_002716 [Xenoophorus captivus]|uniref:Pecanex-like protein n=1 Tax=Xenoophorus captivus TaxID=1517983 RepID=A0ABV0RJY2_9TELE